MMTLTKKLLRIVEITNSDGGLSFLKIRALLESIDERLAEGDPRAMEFARAMDTVLRMAEYAQQQKFDNSTG